jgi:hypothetical protein
MQLIGLDQVGPPFRRGGRSAVFSIDVMRVPACGAPLRIDIEHKNLEDTTWTSLASFASIMSTGVRTQSITGCKEVLRLSPAASGGGMPQGRDAYVIKFLPATWRP